ncbi:helix-turn-helix transcriptional regulator [Actinoplanes sp. NBRC 103695]|uniref:helix-turn-helix domain-containing protein n=1 Tax=Actinoplanes sp. NBRC 103695 TaxID=3032202 RepID=UPI002552428F|nr:helix-turn-helix transcriptional regulator [Actinoplanes sp. NBRC 103695]
MIAAEGVRRMFDGNDGVLLQKPAAVHVVAVATLTDQTHDDLAACAGVPIVLVVDDLTDQEYKQVCDRGVAAVVPTAEVTKELLGAAVTGAARHPRSPIRYEGTRVVLPRLDAREIRLLTLFSNGMNTHEVAVALHLSERMVKRILARVIDRHQLRNRSHAVAYALRYGCI